MLALAYARQSEGQLSSNLCSASTVTAVRLCTLPAFSTTPELLEPVVTAYNVVWYFVLHSDDNVIGPTDNGTR